LSDDSSESADLQVLKTIEPKPQKTTEQLQPPAQYESFLFNLFLIVCSRLQSVPQPLKPRPQPIAEYVLFSGLFIYYFIVTGRFQDRYQLHQLPALPQPKILRHIVLDGQNVARK